MCAKYLADFQLLRSESASPTCRTLTLEACDPDKGKAALAEAQPGQFVNVQVLQSHSTFLRRPISICNTDPAKGLLTLLVKDAGPATHALCEAEEGEIFNILLPLGRGFSLDGFKKPLLVGGGVGTAPLLMFGERLAEKGVRPTFLIGAATSKELLLTELLSETGDLLISTDDGSEGTPGFVTLNPALTEGDFDFIACCGPKPMMKGIAREAVRRGIPCEVSLENKMACGLGACLCCVEETHEGNKCVCTSGPVFNINELNW